MSSVRLSSIGNTILPSSSTFLTMPVDFILFSPVSEIYMYSIPDKINIVNHFFEICRNDYVEVHFLDVFYKRKAK